MNPIEPEMAEQLLEGSIPDHEIPAALAPIAHILRAADAPARPDEVAHAPEAIRRIFDEARRPPSGAPVAQRGDERRLSDRWSLRAAVAAVIAAITLSGGAALAATGNLPAPIQSMAHDLFGSIGVDVPVGSDGDDVAPPTTDDPAGGTTSTAPTSTATTSPTTEAPPTTIAPDGGVPGAGDETCAEASGGVCRAGEPNPSDTRPSTDPSHPNNDSPSETRPSVDPTHPNNESPSVTRPGGPPSTVGGPPVTPDNGPPDNGPPDKDK